MRAVLARPLAPPPFLVPGVLLALVALLAACAAAPAAPQPTATIRTTPGAPSGSPAPVVTLQPATPTHANASPTPGATPAPTAALTHAPTPVPAHTPSPKPSPTAAPAATRAVVTATSLPQVTTGKRPLIAVDPGHGGGEVGATHANAAGQVIREKDVNLAIARRLRTLLEASGYQVVLTRDADVGANQPPIDGNGDGTIDLQDDLQARIDIANAAGAQLLLSIHNNGHADGAQSGSEVYYCQHRPHAERNLTLAQALQRAFVRRLTAVGHPVADRGVKGDENFRILNGVPQHVSLLGPPQPPRILRASQMPGVLGESLFLSNAEGALLAREDVQQAVAQAYFDAVDAYFSRYPAP